MTVSARTQSLLDRIPDHPLAASIRAAVFDAHGAAEAFAAKKMELAKAGTLTAKGQHQAMRDELVHRFGKDLARSRDPIRKIHKDIQSRRDALRVKAVDPTNFAAAIERQETRQWLRSLDTNARQAVALTTKDVRILEAMVTAPPELSGFDGRLAHVADQVEARYMELTYPEEIAALKSMEAVAAEGQAAIDVAAVLIKGTSDLDDRQFDLLMKPIEQKIGAPWLLKSAGSSVVQVCEIGPDGAASYRTATEADLANGVEYENAAAYRAVQGLAA